MIEEQKNEVSMEERNDLFSAMLAVNMGSLKDSPNEQLSENELLGWLNFFLPFPLFIQIIQEICLFLLWLVMK